MKFKEFIKMYYKYTYKDMPNNSPNDLKSRSYLGSIYRKEKRTFMVCGSYIITPIFVTVLLLMQWWWVAIIYLLIDITIMLTTYRFGFVYYFICWYVYEHFDNSYNSLLKKYFFDKTNPAILFDSNNNKYVMTKKGNTSLLVGKFRMHKKGTNDYINYCNVLFKFNKVVIKKK